MDECCCFIKEQWKVNVTRNKPKTTTPRVFLTVRTRTRSTVVMLDDGDDDEDDGGEMSVCGRKTKNIKNKVTYFPEIIILKPTTERFYL